MQIYLVGGAVRDTLLGLPVQDRDWVVVGATPQQMVAQGYVAVGKDFPVFLHPHSREQYALARTERKTAPGYYGFAIHAASDVTLEQDLARRDLTINAIAVAAEHLGSDGNFDPASTELADPYHGQRDLQHKVLRHVSDAFHEDPVRILRVARFAARFADFQVAAETMELMRSMVAHGETAHLVAERVWQELARGLMEPHPSRMLEVLQACGALATVLPELGSDSSAPVSAHLKQLLDLAALLQAPLPVRFAGLCLHLANSGAPVGGKGGVIERLCQRLRAPTDCRELAEVAARESRHIHACAGLDAPALVQLLERCDAFRKPARFAELLLVCQCDAGAGSYRVDAPYPPRERMGAVLLAAQSVATADVAARALASGIGGRQVGAMIHAERVAAVAALHP